MSAIRATWTNGHIVLDGPVDWPEGSQLLVAPVPSSEKIGMDESEWQDDPQSIAEWIAWVDTIQPLALTDVERTEMERYRAEQKRFNIAAVRKQASGERGT